MLPTPRALLLDFGGVIADGPESPDWAVELAGAVREVLASAGVAPVPAEAVTGALTARRTRAALTRGNHASLWGDIIAAGWPPEVRAAVAAHAEWLSRRYMEIKHAKTWQLRPGMAGLLAEAYARGLPMAVVSNTLHGAPHREFLARSGVADRFVTQLYSDEQGVRKPDPELAHRAVAALGVEPAGCWFVGDTRSRDVLVARRAGLAVAVLMRSLRVERPPHLEGTEPDAEVADPPELHTLLAAHW